MVDFRPNVRQTSIHLSLANPLANFVQLVRKYFVSEQFFYAVIETVESVSCFNLKQTTPNNAPNILILTGEKLCISNYAHSLLKDEGQVCRTVLVLYVHVLVYIGVWYICRHMRALQCRTGRSVSCRGCINAVLV